MKQPISKIFAGVALAGLLVATAAQAQEPRVGFVRTDRVLKEANPAKAAQAKLQQEFAKREKEITDLAAQLKANADKLQADAPTLSDSQKLTRQRQLTDLDRDVQRRKIALQEDLNARKNEQLQTILASANKAVKQVAEAEKIDLVLQDAVYANPKLDITDKVIAILNSEAAK